MADMEYDPPHPPPPKQGQNNCCALHHRSKPRMVVALHWLPQSYVILISSSGSHKNDRCVIAH